MIDVFSTMEFQLSLLLFTALFGYVVASRLNQSAVIGEILVGILIGPAVLGWISYTDFVKSVAQFGAIVLLFVVGLEFRPKDIMKRKYFVIALSGVIFPWLIGFGFAKLFGMNHGSAILIGTALTATSIAITANVLKEMGKLKTDVAKAIIGAAVIDDVLSLLALSISAQAIAGQISYVKIIVLVVEAILFFLIGILLGDKLFKRVIQKIDTGRIGQKYPEFVFIFAMMIAFFYGLVAEIIGLSAIVGSFIAGVSIAGTELKHSKSYKEGAEYLEVIFSAVFFISLGILADFRGLTISTWIFVALLTIVAIASKLIGCYIPARYSGMSKRDSLIVGLGMSPRGEVAMIVALLGLNMGIIGQDVYVPIVFMSLLTTMFTPLFLRRLFSKHHSLPTNK